LKSKKARLSKELDALWSELVKIKAGYRCEYSNKSNALNSHHIYSRSKKSTRWDIENGVCLTASHHVLSSGFSAHKTPTEFVEWIKIKRGNLWYNELRKRASQTKKWTIGDMEERIKTFKLIIKTYNGGL